MRIYIPACFQVHLLCFIYSGTMKTGRRWKYNLHVSRVHRHWQFCMRHGSEFEWRNTHVESFWCSLKQKYIYFFSMFEIESIWQENSLSITNSSPFSLSLFVYQPQWEAIHPIIEPLILPSSSLSPFAFAILTSLVRTPIDRSTFLTVPYGATTSLLFVTLVGWE